jgi:hypothetical protein
MVPGSTPSPDGCCFHWKQPNTAQKLREPLQSHTLYPYSLRQTHYEHFATRNNTREPHATRAVAISHNVPIFTHVITQGTLCHTQKHSRTTCYQSRCNLTHCTHTHSGKHTMNTLSHAITVANHMLPTWITETFSQIIPSLPAELCLVRYPAMQVNVLIPSFAVRQQAVRKIDRVEFSELKIDLYSLKGLQTFGVMSCLNRYTCSLFN